MDIYDQLKRDEGIRLKPYKDTVGKLTIGVGRNLDDVGISPEEATYLLKNDVGDKAKQLSNLFPWFSALDEQRRGVLLNMAFNLGVHGLLQFKKMLAAVEAKDWLAAQAEMMDSEWAKQLPARSYRLGQQMITGVWQ